MKCKCHGVSGSCSIRTCWRGLQDLREIAIDLKNKYLSATKVVHRPMGTRKQLVPKDIDIRPVRENELVYLQSSPDFCTKNEKLGSVGTQERWDHNVILLCLTWLRSDTDKRWWQTGNYKRLMPAHLGCWIKWRARPVGWDHLVGRLADNKQWLLRGLRLWPVWALNRPMWLELLSCYLRSSLKQLLMWLFLGLSALELISIGEGLTNGK